MKNDFLFFTKVFPTLDSCPVCVLCFFEINGLLHPLKQFCANHQDRTMRKRTGSIKENVNFIALYCLLKSPFIAFSLLCARVLQNKNNFQGFGH